MNWINAIFATLRNAGMADNCFGSRISLPSSMPWPVGNCREDRVSPWFNHHAGRVATDDDRQARAGGVTEDIFM